MGEVGAALKRKIGPAPAYVWLGLFAVVMIVFRMLRPPAPASAGGPLESSGPVVPVNIGPVRSERTVETRLFRQPVSPFPDVGLIKNRKSQSAFDALRTWWMGGGSGTPPDSSGIKNKQDRLLYASELQFYQANPYVAPGTIPGGSSYSTQAYDPTTGEPL